MLNASINFKVGVRPLHEDPSVDALTELDQTRRDHFFLGDSIVKKDLIKSQIENH